MLPRVLEPEAMDTEAEAVDYDAMDHGEVNRKFAAELLALGPADEEILDLGTGTALIPLELCRQSATVWVLAVDIARHMIDVARQNVQRAALSDRIRLELVDCKRLPYADGQFATVMSNSIFHHIPQPVTVLAEAWRVLCAGGLLFLRDLLRPADEPTLRLLVDTYTVGCNAHQRLLFEDSLRASLSVEEMQALAAEVGIPPDTVRATSDRHWTLAARKA